MTTQAQAQDKQQPLWVQDLLAWLEKIKALPADKQPEAIKELLAELPPTRASVQHQALAVVLGIKSTLGRVGALADVVACLPEDDRQPVLQETLDAVRQIEDGRDIEASPVDSHLPDTESQPLHEVLNAARQIQEESYRAQALRAVAAHLPATELQLLHETLDAACQIQNELFQAQALTAVAARLPANDPQLLRETLDAACQIQEELYRAQVLTAVAARLPASEPQLLHKTLAAAREIKDEMQRGSALAKIAAHLPASEPQLLRETLDAACQIQDEGLRQEVLEALATHWPTTEPQLMYETLAAAHQIQNDELRVRVLVTVASHLPVTETQLLHQALAAAHGIQHEGAWPQAPTTAAPDLTEGDRQSAQHEMLDAARQIRYEWPRAQALAAVASHLPEGDRQPVLYEALDVAREIQHEWHRAQALLAVAIRLPEGYRQPVLHEMLVALNEFEIDDRFRADNLAEVMPRLPVTEPRLLHEALAAVREIKDEYVDRAPALAAVAAHLPTTAPQLLYQALAAARETRDEKVRAKALAAVAPRMPDNDRQAILQEVLAVARVIKYEWNRAEALTGVAAHLPATEPQMLQEDLAAAREIKDEKDRSQALAAVASRLPLQRALEILQEIRIKENRFSVLSAFAFSQPENLIPQLPSAEFSTVLEAVGAGENSAARTKLLSALAPRLSPGLFPNTLELLRNAIPHPACQAEGLSNLANYLPPEQLWKALDLIDTAIPGFSYRTTALCNLMPYLSLPQLDRALDIAGNHISIPDLTAQILRAAATRLAQLQTGDGTETQADAPEPKTSLAQKILDRIQPEITAEKDKTSILTALAPSLTTDAHLHLIQTWLAPEAADTSGIHSESCQADILAALARAPQLARHQLAPFRELVRNLRQDGPKAQALSAFIPDYPKVHAALLELLDHPSATLNPIRKADIAVALAGRPRPAESDAAALTQLTTDQSRALRAIRSLAVDITKASYLEKLAPHLLPGQSLEAQSIALDIQNISYRAQALIALAAHFPAVRPEALHLVRQVQNQDRVRGIELLSQLATIVPEHIPLLLREIETGELSEEGPPTSQDTVDYNHQRILLALKPHLPIRLDREIDHHTRYGQVPLELWNRTLDVLRRDYHEALKSGSLRNDAARGEDLLDLKDEIHALADMLLMRDLEPPVAVGILGGWGEGKSYILHLMQTRMVEIRSQSLDEIAAWGIDLARDKTLPPAADRLNRYVGHIYQINFDAWTYAKSNLWASLMQTIFFELDRQITLEQQLKAAGLNFFEDEDSKIWQTLYETSDEDRKWLLENVLISRPDILEKWRQQAQFPGAGNGLWALFAASQTEALNNLKKVEQQLEEQKEALCQTRSQVIEKGIQRALIATTVRASAKLLKSRLGSSFEQDFIQKAEKAIVSDIEGKPEPDYSAVKEDIEQFFKQQNFSIDIKFLLQFVRQHALLVSLCSLLLLVAILLPLGLARFGTDVLVQQLIAGAAPLLSMIPIAKGLLKKGQTLYAEVKDGINDFKQQLEQGILESQLEDDEEFQKGNRQMQLLEKEVAARYEAIPANVYASIAEFVSDRLESGGYQEHLGLMH